MSKLLTYSIMQQRRFGNIVTDDLTLYYDAGKLISYSGSGTTVTDLSSNVKDGTLINGVGFDINEPKTFTFDGSDDYIKSSGTVSDFIKVNDATVNVWCNPTGTPPTISQFYLGEVIATYARSSAGGYFGIGRGISGGNDRIHVFNLPQNIQVAYNNDEWINITLVHAGGVLYAYKNGELVSSISSGNSGGFGAGTPFYFGWNSFAGYYKFQGDISVMMTYNRGLSDTEVLRNYNAFKSRYI